METQRPVDPPHVKEIVEYLKDRVQEDNPYWFGQLAFNLHEGERVRILTTDDFSAVRQAILLIPKGAQMFPVDGNHRLSAFEKLMAIEEDGDETWDTVREDAIQWCLIDEPNPERARQLFHDAGQAKPLPPALLVSFAMYDAFPVIVKEVAKGTPIFRNRIDYLSKSLGRDHRYILTVNQLRIVCAEFLFGKSNRKAIQTEASEFGDAESRQGAAQRTIEFFEHLAEALGPVWQKLLAGEAVALAHYREDRVDFTTSGLQAIARAGHDIWQLDETDRCNAMSRFSSIDFSRSAPTWQDCGLVTPFELEDGSTSYRVATQTAAVNGAYMAIKELVGLS